MVSELPQGLKKRCVLFRRYYSPATGRDVWRCSEYAHDGMECVKSERRFNAEKSQMTVECTEFKPSGCSCTCGTGR